MATTTTVLAQDAIEGKAKAPKPRRSYAKTHPSTSVMVQRAIRALKDPNGTSTIAIRKYILANYKTVQASRIKGMLKRALQQGLMDGTLLRPKSQSSMAVLNGRYMLAPRAVKTTLKKAELVAEPMETETPEASMEIESPIASQLEA